MRNNLIVFIYLCLLLLVVPMYIIDIEVYSKAKLSMVILLVSIVLVLFLLFRKEKATELKRNYFRPVFLFLIGYVIVHFQKNVDLLLGLVTENQQFYFPYNGVICKAAILALIGLICFCIGYMSCKSRFKTKFIVGNACRSTYYLSILSVILLIVFIRYAGVDYIIGGYGEKNLEGLAAYSSLLLNVVLYSIMILKSYNVYIAKSSIVQYLKMYEKPFYVSFCLYIAVIIMSGDRGPMISLILAFVLNYFLVTRRKMKIVSLLICALVGGTVISLLGVARKFSAVSDSFSEKMLIASQIRMEPTSFLPMTEELAGSTRCLNYALAYVPDEHPYLNGQFFAKNILSIMPFNSSVTNSIFDSRFRYKGSASFITWIEQGDHPNSGVGTTCIADLYLDFGLIGVMFFMLLFGMIFRFLEIQLFVVRTPSLWIYSVGFYLMTCSLYLSRSSFFLGIRSIVWMYVIICGYIFIVRKYARKKSVVSGNLS